MMRSLLVVWIAALSYRVYCFSVTDNRKSYVLCASGENEPQKKGGFFSDFFEELDAFVDDATSRRLGAGSAFYGKRKSNFYGAEDKGRKMERDMPDPTEDYQGPSQSGYFKWMPDENGQLKPVTRMKEKVIERNPNYWDRVFSEKDE